MTTPTAIEHAELVDPKGQLVDYLRDAKQNLDGFDGLSLRGQRAIGFLQRHAGNRLTGDLVPSGTGWAHTLYRDNRSEPLIITTQRWPQGDDIRLIMRSLEWMHTVERSLAGLEQAAGFILRPRSSILLFQHDQEPAPRCILQLMPDLAGHETFEELEAVKRDFPGRFFFPIGEAA